MKIIIAVLFLALMSQSCTEDNEITDKKDQTNNLKGMVFHGVVDQTIEVYYSENFSENSTLIKSNARITHPPKDQNLLLINLGDKLFYGGSVTVYNLETQTDVKTLDVQSVEQAMWVSENLVAVLYYDEENDQTKVATWNTQTDEFIVLWNGEHHESLISTFDGLIYVPENPAGTSGDNNLVEIDPKTGESSIIIYDLDGGTDGREEYKRSYDGAKIVAVGYDKGWGTIDVIDLSSGNRTTFDINGGLFGVSKTKDEIAVFGENGLGFYNFKGELLTKDLFSPEEIGRGDNPRYSKDGQSLLYIKANKDVTEFTIMKADLETKTIQSVSKMPFEGVSDIDVIFGLPYFFVE